MTSLVLWGHGLDDYQEMFALSKEDLKGRILEFASGPSAFNAELHAQGKDVVSCDPLFSLDKDTLYSKSVLVFADRAQQLKAHDRQFNFSAHGDLPKLLTQRKTGMELFFTDYIKGKQENRYIPLRDFPLPFADFSFNLALCSHYLFGELDNQDLSFHLQVLKELARVAKEVRVFPLIDRDGQPSPFLGPVLLALQQEDYGVEVKSIPYRLQNQGNAMLKIWAIKCNL